MVILYVSCNAIVRAGISHLFTIYDLLGLGFSFLWRTGELSIVADSPDENLVRSSP